MSTEEIYDIPDARLLEIKEAIETDEELQTFKETVMNGWAELKQDAPLGVRQYFDFRDTISHSNGLLLKREAVIIPKALRKEMKTRLHKVHFGHDSMMRIARGTIFWPGLRSNVKQMADCCEICQERKPINCKEPLIQH